MDEQEGVGNTHLHIGCDWFAMQMMGRRFAVCPDVFPTELR
jgi:hypothetical protein